MTNICASLHLSKKFPWEIPLKGSIRRSEEIALEQGLLEVRQEESKLVSEMEGINLAIVVRGCGGEGSLSRGVIRPKWCVVRTFLGVELDQELKEQRAVWRPELRRG